MFFILFAPQNLHISKICCTFAHKIRTRVRVIVRAEDMRHKVILDHAHFYHAVTDLYTDTYNQWHDI